MASNEQIQDVAAEELRAVISDNIKKNLPFIENIIKHQMQALLTERLHEFASIYIKEITKKSIAKSIEQAIEQAIDHTGIQSAVSAEVESVMTSVKIQEDIKRSVLGKVNHVIAKSLSKMAESVRYVELPSISITLDGLEEEDALSQEIERLEISVRSFNALSSMGCKTVRDVVLTNPRDVFINKNVGKKTLADIRDSLSFFGVDWFGTHGWGG